MGQNRSHQTNLRNTAPYEVMTGQWVAPHHIQKRSWPSEHTEPEEQSLPTCSENPAVDRCPATAGVDVKRPLLIVSVHAAIGSKPAEFD